MVDRQGAMEDLGVNSFWHGRRVLLTGHTGFKGAWLTLWLEHLGAEVIGFSLPHETQDCAYAAFWPRERLLSRLGDLRDRDALRDVVGWSRPEVVFHLGAQALVGRGWSDPGNTYETNVVGTSNLLESLARTGRGDVPVVVATSDKVYANNERGIPFNESSPLGGADPYSASKAAAEHVVHAWRRGNPHARVATARAGNVIGGGDVGADRLVPDAWRALQAEHPLLLRNPEATRPWQFVLEPLAGYLALAKRLAVADGDLPAAFNFGPDDSSARSAADVADAIFEQWGSGTWSGSSAPPQPEAVTLRLDSELARRVLGWKPRLTIDDAIAWTVEWWRAARDSTNMRNLAIGQILAYDALAD